MILKKLTLQVEHSIGRKNVDDIPSLCTWLWSSFVQNSSGSLEVQLSKHSKSQKFSLGAEALFGIFD